MATNTLLTPQIIANELLRRFQNNLAFTSGLRHEYDDRFAQKGGKIGATLNLRIPVRFGASDGAALVVQDVTELEVPLVINQRKHTGFSFTSQDLTLTVDRFGERYLDGAAVALGNIVDVIGLQTAYQAAYNSVGTPGTVPSALKTYNQAGALLDKNGCPFDEKRSLIINSDMNVEIVDSLKGLLNPSKLIGSQFEKGRMGRAVGFEWMADQNVRTHTVGPQGGASPAVSSDAAQIGSTLHTVGWTTAAAVRLNKGDIFTVDGVYMLNPVSGDVQSNLQQFVVTAQTSSLSDGTMAIPISPAISIPATLPAINAYATVSNSPASGALLHVVGAAGTLSPQGIAYHQDAMAFAMVPLEVPQGVHFAARQTDKESGMSLRIVSQYDITTDVFATRVDILFGFAVALPQWLVRIQS